MKGLVRILIAAVLYGMGCSANAITGAQFAKAVNELNDLIDTYGDHCFDDNTCLSGEWVYVWDIDEMTDYKRYMAYTIGLQAESTLYVRCIAGDNNKARALDIYLINLQPLVEHHRALVRFDKEEREEVTAAMAVSNKGLFLAPSDVDWSEAIGFLRKLEKHKTLRIRVVVKDQGLETYQFNLRGSRKAIRTAIKGCQGQ